MKWVKGLSGLGVLAWLAVAWAVGTSADVTWEAPTVYTDGSPLPASDIAYYTLVWAPATGTSPALSGSLKINAGTLKTTVPVPCGGTQFTISVTTTATAAFPNQTSAAAGPAPYATGVACRPNPPGGLAAH